MSESSPTPSGLGLRTISALVLAPLTLAVIFAGGIPFIILMAVAFFIAVREWRNMVIHAEHPHFHLALGSLYLAVCCLSFAVLRLHFAQGMWLTLCLLIAVWASDCGAYFMGKAIGGPKLAPRLSPKKTWAGLFGAMIFSGLSLVLLFLAEPFIPYIDAATRPQPLSLLFIAGALLGMVGQAGDLMESCFKRRVGMKDSGQLIPGHGGLLDRIDSLLLATPAFLLLSWFWLS